jgi:hypothetical protein
MRPYPLQGLSFMVDFKIPVKPLVLVVRPSAALRGPESPPDATGQYEAT